MSSTAEIRTIRRPRKQRAFVVSIANKSGEQIAARTFERFAFVAVDWAMSFNVRRSGIMLDKGATGALAREGR